MVKLLDNNGKLLDLNINKVKILNFFSSNENKDFGYCDDCISYKLKIEPRQNVNQICRMLEDEDKIEWIESNCKICKKQKILNFHKEHQ